MNVLIITEDDPFYVYEFFKLFFPKAARAPYRIHGISILAPFNKRSRLALARQMWNFYGPFHFVRMGFLYVFKKISRQTIENLAKKFGIPHFAVTDVNSSRYIDTIRKMRTDIVVSIAAPQLFKKELLQAAPRGCINSHSSLLPENKGMMPVFWGLFKDEEHIGVTIHYMDEELDRGAIIKQVKVPVGAESLHEMIVKTKHLSAQLIDESLREIMTGQVKPYLMPPGGSYQTFPTRAEVRMFKQKGKRFF